MVVDSVVVEEEVSTDSNYWRIFIEQSKLILSDKDSSDTGKKTVDTSSLEELYNLYQKGILTEDEYKAKKEEFLKRL